MYNKYGKILDHIHAGVLYCKNDQYSTIIYANDYFYKMIGYTREEIEKNHNNRFADFVVDDVSAILVQIDKKIAANEDLDYEYRMRRKDGSIFWIHDTAKYDRENNCWFVTIMDISDMKSLNYERERLEFYLNSIPNKIVISDAEGKIIYKNKEANECSYYDTGATHLNDLIGKHILGRSYESIFNEVAHGHEVRYETRYRQDNDFIGHDANTLIPIEATDKQGKNYMMVSEDLLRNSDILTGFPTHMMFKHYYNYYMSFSPECIAYACMVDIDDFKVINDTYGHSIGDMAIKLTGKRLTQLLEKEDYICRYGGDEFMILFLNQPKEAIISKLNNLIEITSEPVSLHNNQFYMTYSIGLVSVKPGTDYDKVFNKADQALYKVKGEGKSHLVEYSTENTI